MRSFFFSLRVLGCVVVFLAVFGLSCKPKSTEQADANKPQPADDIAVTINGVDITEAKVQELLKPELEKMAQQSKQLPPAFAQTYKKQLRQRVLEIIIAEHLLDEKVKEANIVITEEELNDQFTPVVPTPTPTPTFTPTPTPTPSYEFMYEEGSMQTAPNCSTVYLKIKVVGVGGEPVNGIAVRLQWAGFTDHKITGQGGEPAGEVGFAPLGPDSYHSPMDFHIQLVQSPSDPSPRSNEKIVHFTDCATAGAFTNIKFVYQW